MGNSPEKSDSVCRLGSMPRMNEVREVAGSNPAVVIAAGTPVKVYHSFSWSIKCHLNNLKLYSIKSPPGRLT